MQLALTTTRVEQRNFGLWINNWQVGQTLNALVTNQLPTGELVLRVAGQQITATSDIPIQQGSNLLLEVKQMQPVPTLRVLSPLADPVSNARVAGTLQLLVPGGGTVASPPLAAVAQAVQSTQLSAVLMPILGEPLGQLLRQFSRFERLTQADGVAGAVRDSGIFLEGKLRASLDGGSVQASGDLKAGLFRALARVDAALSEAEALSMSTADAEALQELRRELESGLGRITLQQFNAQPSDAQGLRSWQVEIPVLIGQTYHSLRVDIERHSAADDGSAGAQSKAAVEDDDWRVRLRIAPPALGALDINIRLFSEQLHLRFAVERDEVRTLIDRGLPQLQRALASRGLELSTTSARPLSVPPGPDTASSAPESSLDLRV
jgi:hypothetical protein